MKKLLNDISELPEPILHHILSFIPTKDATRTRVLSKTWNSAWNSVPVLIFNQYYFNDYENDEEFYSYVNNSMARRCRNRSIQSLKLSLYVMNPPQLEDVKRWLSYAVSKNVEHLVLQNFGYWYREYELPTSTLFCSKSLKELSLLGFKIVIETSRCDRNIIGCFPLKTLKLETVSIDDQTLRSLLSNSCSSLEEVSIRHCKGFRSLSLCSTKLKSVELYLYGLWVKNITIEAPNLRLLSLGGDRCDNLVTSSLVAASKYNNKNLKELELWGVDINDASFQVIQEFEVLEKLKLFECFLQDNIEISSYTTIRLKNGELIADYLNCMTQKDRIKLFGLYKIGI